MARQAGRNSRDKDLDVRILSETRYILHFALHCIIPAIVARSHLPRRAFQLPGDDFHDARGSRSPPREPNVCSPPDAVSDSIHYTATHDHHARNPMFCPQATTRWNRIDRSHEPRSGRLLHDERRWYVSYEGLC